MEQTATHSTRRGRKTRERNKGGFTLIEVMVALIILAIGMMVSTMGIMAAINQGVLDDMRSNAMKIGQEQLETARNMPYGNIQTSNLWPTQITRQVEKANVTYNVQMNFTPSAIGGNVNQDALVQFIVTWQFKPPLENSLHTYKYVTQTIVRSVQ
ncbi:MAG: type IV pilus modification PilV family protein [Syntrophobacteraceae bacterium]